MMYKIIFLLDGHTPTGNIEKAAKSLRDSGLPISVTLLRQIAIDSNAEARTDAFAQMDDADFIVIASHGSITGFRQFNAVMDRYGKDKKMFFHTGVQDEVNEIVPGLLISQGEYLLLYRYYVMNTEGNYRNMMLCTASLFGVAEYEYADPVAPEWDGLYRTDAVQCAEGIVRARAEGKTVVGILFGQHLMQDKNVAHIDALIDAVVSRGAFPVPVFTCGTKDPSTGRKGIESVLRKYLMQDEISLVDVLINTCGYSMTIFNSNDNAPEVIDVSVFGMMKIPVLQAYSTYFTYDQWKESIIGLDSMALVSGIYYPEFDGQIGTYPIASHRYSPERGIFAAEPIADRIDKVVRLSLNWAHLHRMKNEDKKVAIIFHNSPPRNDMIGGAAGLDSPASVLNIIQKLKSQGVKVDYDFATGDDIIYRIIEGVSNDTSWLSPEDVLARSIDVIDKDMYESWYNPLPANVKDRLVKDWGEAPGTFMVHDGKMPVPGILNGNIFIGLQPARAFEEKAEQCYHSCDFVCPHQYIAFYKWVKHRFKADLIMHIGTHGTIEWLPGKEKGLSEECFPDVCIDDIPHLYPYLIGVLGEGIQCKRRTAAVILEHMIPSMVESGTYDDLSDLDEMLKEYFRVSVTAKAQVPVLESRIWEMTKQLNLHIDLLLPEDCVPADFDAFVAQLHSWTETIKQSTIKDGLHIFGQAPENERFTNMIRLLTRIKNGSIPSLPQGIAEALGYDYTQLSERPDEFVKPAVTGHLALDECTEKAVAVIDTLHLDQYRAESVSLILVQHFGENVNTARLEECLRYICAEVKPRLSRTIEELDWCITGANGGFVSPGPGGSPSRGNVRILPTGRNFYSIDPAAVPSQAAFAVGKRMAEELIARYQKDENRFPESIGIVLYAGDQMKTSGDDIAEVLWLMGVRPVWIGQSNRVSGLEVVPLEELGRPRIDVTCRVTGLLRDTFPNLIEMIDNAVNMVAAVDEPADQNFVRKHIEDEIAELTAQGIDPRTARQESMLRVFGCPPGTYGGGVDILVESKKWETADDLGYISVTWGCHAYSTELHGEVCRGAYERRLSKTDVTVKNENSVEFDIYEIDDEYIYHGGMIAAVSKLSGKKPRSYYGNSSNPELTQIADVREETARIVRARLLNPKWIEGLKQHGYKGAQDVSFNMDNLFGWDATANTIEDWMYDALAEHLLFDTDNRKWMDEVNPWASHHINERLLEAIQRKMWNASEEMIERLTASYLEAEGGLESLS